jgi:hypothetical protein
MSTTSYLGDFRSILYAIRKKGASIRKMLTLIPTPSPGLLDSFKSLANDLGNAHDKWERIKSDGAKEGFTENQLIQMVKPFLKERGLSKDQIYYFFHRNQQKERVRRRKLTMKDNKNGTVKSLNAPNVPRKGNIVYYQDLFPDTSGPQANTSSVVDEVEMVEFDLSSARDLLIRLIERTENERNRACIVRFHVKEGILTAIKIKENGFFQEISLPAA